MSQAASRATDTTAVIARPIPGRDTESLPGVSFTAGVSQVGTASRWERVVKPALDTVSVLAAVGTVYFAYRAIRLSLEGAAAQQIQRAEDARQAQHARDAEARAAAAARAQDAALAQQAREDEARIRYAQHRAQYFERVVFTPIHRHLPEFLDAVAAAVSESFDKLADCRADGDALERVVFAYIGELVDECDALFYLFKDRARFALGAWPDDAFRTDALGWIDALQNEFLEELQGIAFAGESDPARAIQTLADRAAEVLSRLQQYDMTQHQAPRTPPASAPPAAP